MKVTATAIPEVVIIEPKVHGDARGFFLESYNQRDFRAATGASPEFVQDAFDVAVDVRRGSPTFGRWVGVELTEENHRQLWVPVGFAHGFLVTSESADFVYKATDYYAPEHERCIAWNDPAIGIDWPLDCQPSLSAKDAAGVPLAKAEVFES